MSNFKKYFLYTRESIAIYSNISSLKIIVFKYLFIMATIF